MGLNLTPYMTEVDDLEIGDTVRLNHDDCAAGTDSRRRLYITRPQANPETVVAYCHNCQQGGYHVTGQHSGFRRTRHENTPAKNIHKVQDTLSVPPNLLDDIDDWPLLAQAWAYKGRMNKVLIRGYGIAYDPSSDRVYIPRYNWHSKHGDTYYFGDLQGYQLRNVDADTKRPKYLTVTTKDDTGFSLLKTETAALPTTRAVLVEDLLSGIHIVEATHAAGPTATMAIVNYGTQVQLPALHACALQSRAIVWLDNDSKHVVEQAEQMARTINLINSQCLVRVIGGKYSDPKHHTWDEINHILGDS